MKTRTVLFMMLGFGLATLESAEYGDYERSLASARQNNRPLLIEYSADWCHFCRQMEKETLTNESIQAAMNPFEFVKIDFDQSAELARKHGVNGIPAFVLVSPDEDLIESTSGFQPVEMFRQWLMQSQTAAAHVEAKKAVFNRRANEVKAKLENGDPESTRSAVRELLAMASERDNAPRDFAKKHLAALAQTDALLLEEGLNHPQLSVRLLVANLFRDQPGFTVDPWADKEDRLLQIKEWATAREANPAVE